MPKNTFNTSNSLSTRCRACDWSPSSRSQFNEQIVYPHGSYPYRLVFDPKSKETYCNSCYDSFQLTIAINNAVDNWES